MICRDNELCSYWFTTDGAMVCRHGLVAEADVTTAVDIKCPLDILHESERKKWERFYKNLPMIMKRINERFALREEES